jgi:hypothetical protein
MIVCNVFRHGHMVNRLVDVSQSWVVDNVQVATLHVDAGRPCLSLFSMFFIDRALPVTNICST